jgi:hypothetical protein
VLLGQTFAILTSGLEASSHCSNITAGLALWTPRLFDVVGWMYTLSLRDDEDGASDATLSSSPGFILSSSMMVEKKPCQEPKFMSLISRAEVLAQASPVKGSLLHN